MSAIGKISESEAAKCLRALTYIKLDLNAFIVVTKKPSDEASMQDYESIYGSTVFLPAPESIMQGLSGNSHFLEFRADVKSESGFDLDSTSFNKKCAQRFITAMFEILGMKTESDEKMNVYISRNEISKLRNSTVFEIKDLYSHLNRSGSNTFSKKGGSGWG